MTSPTFSTSSWSDAFEDMVKFTVDNGKLHLGDLQDLDSLDACNGDWIAWGHRKGDKIDSIVAMTMDLYKVLDFVIKEIPEDSIVVCHNEREFAAAQEKMARLSQEAVFLNKVYSADERSLTTPSGVFFLGNGEPDPDDALCKAVNSQGATYGDVGNGLSAGLFENRCSIVELRNELVDAIEFVEIKAH